MFFYFIWKLSSKFPLNAIDRKQQITKSLGYCITVYLTNMKMLQEVTPRVHRESTENRAHAVSTSSSESLFNSVSPEMALEQTVNRDSKIKGGIVGGTGMEGTRYRWALPVHMMAAATASFKVMSGTSAGSSFHKELGPQRIERDKTEWRQ